MIDDPRAVFAVHGLCGFWGLISVCIFGRKNEGLLEYGGLIHGEYYLLMIQFIAALVIALWGMLSTYTILCFINLMIPLRTPLVNELLGAAVSNTHLTLPTKA